MSVSSFNPDLVFVGAGPVGLWTACQTKILNPETEILFLEKHSEYKRSHILLLRKNSFKSHAKDPRLSKVIDDLIASKQKEAGKIRRIWNSFLDFFGLKKYAIRTNDIEKQLLGFAKELGIEFKYESIDDPTNLKKRFPSAKAIIGSDGSHSIVREKIFRNALRAKAELQYITEVKYEVHGSARHLSIWEGSLVKSGSFEEDNSIKQCRQIKKLVSEHIGKPTDGKTPVTVRFFIDKETYEKMARRGISFKNPLSLNTPDEKWNESILDQVNVWLNARQKILKEHRVEGSEKVTMTKLATYVSRQFVKKSRSEDVTYVLVGDAGFGVPFFESMNNGIKSGTVLAKDLAKDPSSRLKTYHSYVKRLATRQVRFAKFKKFFVRLGNSFISFAIKSDYRRFKLERLDGSRFKLAQRSAS